MPAPLARHVLLITVDTLRADRLGCYGGRPLVSPAIDRLAAEGTLFTEAYAPASLTLPAITAMFTSKYPEETGILRNHFQLSDDEETLAERLSGLGFRNRAFVTNPVLRPRDAEVPGPRIDQGFGDGDGYRWFFDDPSMAQAAEEHLAGSFGQAGREFTWVHFVQPHQPYEPAAPYDDLFTNSDYDGPWDGSTASLDRIFTEQVELDPADLEHVLARYDGTVRLVDDLVARLLGALDATGLGEQTLVVLAADHGEDLYDHHRYFYHAKSVHRSSSRIALIVRQPGTVPAGVRRDDLVVGVDLLPTILAHLGGDPADCEARNRPRGLDLSGALLRGEPVRRSYVVTQWRDAIHVLRTSRWAFVHNPDGVIPSDPPPGDHYVIGEQALYDLAADPREQFDVAAAHPDVVAGLRALLDAWRSGLGAGAAPDELQDPRLAEMLAQLGY